MNIELEGLKELQKALESKFDTSQNQEVVKKGADYFKKRLEESVYNYGFKRRSGKSQESIKIDIPGAENEVYVGLSNQSNDAFYLYFHEYGTSRMRARPWMRPTFEREQQAIVEEMAKEMRARLRL